jgi:hypothetical protein
VAHHPLNDPRRYAGGVGQCRQLAA